MNQRLIEIILGNNEFKRLVTELIQEGYISAPYENNRNLVHLVRSVYQRYIYVPDTSHLLSPLPGRKVMVEDTVVYIHGIIHDSLYNITTPNYVQELLEATKEWELVCEDGLTDYGFQTSHSFGEIKVLGLNSRLNLLKTIPSLVKALIVKKLDIHRGVSEDVDLSLVLNIEDLRNVRRTLFSNYLPEPLGMSSILYFSPNSVRIKRYIYEAEYLQGYVQERSPDKLHVLVGCAHELPLEYLLTNPKEIKRIKNKID